jgi:hypothetical protein
MMMESVLTLQRIPWVPGLSAGVCMRDAGAGVLAPTIGCRCSGKTHPVPPSDRRAYDNELHRASEYPLTLSVTGGEYFSEVIGEQNRGRREYRALCEESLAVLAGFMRADSLLPFEALTEAGALLQEIDARFANSRIGKPVDCVHNLGGPDAAHPYGKIIICRTSIPILMPDGERAAFLFEKFLVSYFYTDSDGTRRLTVTPIHSHPINFETVYFVESDSSSKVVEQEFALEFDECGSVVLADGCVSPEFIKRALAGTVRLTLAAGGTTTFRPNTPVRKLEPFVIDQVLPTFPQLLGVLDGYFRPHRVSVHGDRTRYFALDNYFSPTGNVILFGESGQSIWTRAPWTPR